MSQNFTVEDADRILGLGDQFMEDWEAHEGKNAEDIETCKERRSEWDLYRNIFVRSPQMLQLLQSISDGELILTRSEDMAQLRDFLEEVEKETAQWFENHYECYRCNHKWTDKWPAMPDDDCPKCGARHVSPHHSEEIEKPE